jgi:PAS domain S-box-containing protein
VRLNESLKRYRILFEPTRDGLIISGPEGKILSANQAAADIIGFKKWEELIGKSTDEFYADPEQRKTVFKELMKKGSLQEYSVTLKSVNGDLRNVLVTLTLFTDKEGNILQINCIFRDITELYIFLTI